MNYLNNKIIEYSKNVLGFDFIEFAKPELLISEVNYLENWLKHGLHGNMTWLERNIEKRIDVKQILPSTKTVIVLAKNYYNNFQQNDKPDVGKISKYAWGRDYHKVLGNKLKLLDKFLKELSENVENKWYVDTGPIMEKQWAVKAGLGWMGKHTNIITREIGSWIFLSVVLTNLQIDTGSPIEDFCGDCTKCIDACPTDALFEPYKLDSNKCISYLTIELKPNLEINPDLSKNFKNWIFGCDICQDVCPWNKFQKLSEEPDFKPRVNLLNFNLEELLNMEEDEFNLKFEGSPIKRTKHSGIKRNIESIKVHHKK
ncbi:MAG: tRNA epoxyqueuosine(34) reductase QueG [Chlorobiota bacterium]|nr:tRNA epoxyqueuosine(34) reductase QueG [Chlorobiota bacterium]QQS65498.1 MAG: tRNA epoxyqueuosine(34) reductase QueG [Chlorobiota bacterium]